MACFIFISMLAERIIGCSQTKKHLHLQIVCLTSIKLLVMDKIRNIRKIIHITFTPVSMHPGHSFVHHDKMTTQHYVYYLCLAKLSCVTALLLGLTFTHMDKIRISTQCLGQQLVLGNTLIHSCQCI